MSPAAFDRRDESRTERARRPRAPRIAATALVVALIALAGAAFAAGPATFLLGGYLPLRTESLSAWPASEAWVFPVGDPSRFGAEGPGEPAYRLLRGVEWNKKRSVQTHQGADLGNRQGGGAVHAAAAGFVVHVGLGESGGYGHHVVLAHRLVDDALVYSVYAHLAPGSITVHEGDEVATGAVLGRVGRSGRASTDHLHFEIRTAADPGARWQRARAVDPITFVTDRTELGSPIATEWAKPYLEWATAAGLVADGDAGDGVLVRAEWWRMLARATKFGDDPLPTRPDSLRIVLARTGVLPRGWHADAAGRVTWRELARDAGRLRKSRFRLPAVDLSTADHRRTCTMRLHDGHPARHLKRVARLGRAPLTLADACLLVADLGAASPEDRAAR